MKNIFVWVAVALIVLGGGYYLYSSSQRSSFDTLSDTMIKEDSMMKSDVESNAVMDDDIRNETGDAMIKGDETRMTPPGTYESYAISKLAKANDGPVVLFFRASWCPTCRALDSNIRSNLENIPAGVTILDVDYDNSADLKQKYGVTYQHTLVQVNADGSLIKKWSGSPTLSVLLSNIKS